jgi:AmmeMemoRadiSam system protein B
MLLGSFILGHLGLLIDELDYGGSALVKENKKAFKQVGRQIAAMHPDTIVLTTPHNIRYADYIHISPGPGAHGQMTGPWGASIKMDVAYDEEFVAKLTEGALAENIAAGTEWEVNPELDWATMTPLKFVNDYYTDYKLVRICVSGLPFEDHYKLGRIIREISDVLGRKMVFIGSGDLSHRLAPTSPYHYAPEGAAFEEQVVDAMTTSNFLKFLTFDLDFLEIAAECGLRSCIVAAGTLDGRNVEGKLLAHEPSYGVGCSAASYIPLEKNPSRHFLEAYARVKTSDTRVIPLDEDPYIRLAKFAVEGYVTTGEYPKIPRFWPANMVNSRMGLFVTLRGKDSAVRGCMGTLVSEHKNVVEEVFYNAVLSSSKDPKFLPVTAEELPELSYEVSLITGTRPLDAAMPEGGAGEMLLAVSGYKRGFALPWEAQNIQSQRDLALLRGAISPENKTDFFRLSLEIHSA